MAPQYLKLLLSLLFSTTLLNHVSGGYIPHKTSGDTQQDVMGDLLRIPELSKLGKYVCNDHTDLVKRQVGSTSIITTPEAIREILTEMQKLEVKLKAILDQKPEKPPVKPAFSSRGVIVQTVVPLPPTLPSPTIDLESYKTVIEIPPSPTPVLELPPAGATSSIPLPPADDPPGTNPGDTTGSKKYIFNRHSSTNVAVYYGQTAATAANPLTSQCADPSIDIVVLAFVISQNYQGKYPSVNFGATCGGQTTQMQSQAPGLLWCPLLASWIQSCQQDYGKKVFLSIGGATSRISFDSEAQATQFGDTLWGVFGPPGSVDPNLRPFGTVEVDGFDIDNEDYLPAHWNDLALNLRAHYSTVTNKQYYLSSAPQCPPVTPADMALHILCDFVWVQFYNNPSCDIGSPGFSQSAQYWSSALAQSTLSVKPRLYLGAPAWVEAGPGAYNGGIKSPEGMKGVVQSVIGLGLDSFGGVMFWDGSEGLGNVEGGKDILDWAKEGLSS